MSAAARVVGRPVKLVVPRGQMFTTTGHRPETLQRMRLSADAHGKLASLRHEAINTTSFTDDYTETCGVVSQSLYSCANVLVSHKMTRVNRGSPTSMRAPGAAPGLFALESAMDELALDVGMDPVEFRLKNISTMDESKNLPWSSNHLRDAILQGAQKFGWSNRSAQPGSMRDGAEVIGYGVAACNWEAFRTPAEARVQLRSDGTAAVTCALQDIGTGTYTIAAQAVAAVTGLPLERIQVTLGDTSDPSAPLSGGSWVTASLLPAITEATRKAVDQLKTYSTSSSGPFAGAKAETIRFESGTLTDGRRNVDFTAILKSQLHATLADNPTAREFAALLPLHVSMEDLFGREKAGPLPREISTSGPRSDVYKVGDIGYWSPGHDVAIYYRQDGESIPAPGIINIGHVDAGIEAFERPGALDVTIEQTR